MKKFLLPLISLGMLAGALLHVSRAQTTTPSAEPLVTPPRSPFGDTIAE